ncbi:MAG: DUF503 domain-containing protein [Candidatus Omnitrophota bacterium]|nr:MAG: DUF503 domain-containing protein [Candidatus Omnitrophota bacterium]
MRVGVLKIDFHISDSSSLKEKRSVLKHIKDKIRRDFNVSISEVSNHDKWQLATFAASCVSNDKKHVDATLNKVKNFFEKNRNIVVVDYQIEMI